MVLTVTANPCVDKTLSVDRLDFYKMNRAEVVRTDVSGKGINVSKALALLGRETLCTGFDFSQSRAGEDTPLKAALRGDGIDCDAVAVKGDLRVCTKIFDKSISHTVEINEYGTPVTEADGERLIERVASLSEKSQFVTLSGSIPRGLSSDFYARCVKSIKQRADGCRVVVDAEGELLLRALEHSPFMIKPNVHELEGTFGIRIDGIDTLDREVRGIIDRYGVEVVCVSLGGDGAYIASKDEAYFCKAYTVEVRSLQGAGDSMIAGICMALEDGLSLSETLRYGLCAAGASVAKAGTQFCTLEEFNELLKQKLTVERVR